MIGVETKPLASDILHGLSPRQRPALNKFGLGILLTILRRFNTAAS
jgi:hypothetical protein